MRILFPLNPLDQSEPDEPYVDEWSALLDAGFSCSLFDFDEIEHRFRPKPAIRPGERILYRGWMLNLSRYASLAEQIRTSGGVPVTSEADYAMGHHLPNWYPYCSEFTPQTIFVDHSDEVERKVAQLGWQSYFVKDFVKSNTGDLASIAHSVAEIRAIAEQIRLYRGEIEGGLAIREVERLRPDTESRHFVVNGQAHSLEGPVPDVVSACAEVVPATFYSIDTALNEAGQYRIVELGDGQVSDRKQWPVEKFLSVIAANASGASG